MTCPYLCRACIAVDDLCNIPGEWLHECQHDDASCTVCFGEWGDAWRSVLGNIMAPWDDYKTIQFRKAISPILTPFGFHANRKPTGWWWSP